MFWTDIFLKFMTVNQAGWLVVVGVEIYVVKNSN
jgi:hypothetical protein